MYKIKCTINIGVYLISFKGKLCLDFLLIYSRQNVLTFHCPPTLVCHLYHHHHHHDHLHYLKSFPPPFNTQFTLSSCSCICSYSCKSPCFFLHQILFLTISTSWLSLCYYHQRKPSKNNNKRLLSATNSNSILCLWWSFVFSFVSYEKMLKRV